MTLNFLIETNATNQKLIIAAGVDVVLSNRFFSHIETECVFPLDDL